MGVWRGWYEQNGTNHEMRLKKFKVKGNKIEGKGQDDHGKFFFTGFYTSENKVQFIKQYEGAHQVHYEGKREGQTLHGRWNLAGMSGGFYLYKENEWDGHYVQQGVQHPMKFGSLKIKGDRISGRGEDTNGAFIVDGRIAQTGELEFTK